MNLLIIKAIKEDPKQFEFLLNNSYLITYLNRNPVSYKDFKKIFQKEKRELKYQKFNQVIDGMNMLSSIIDSVN